MKMLVFESSFQQALPEPCEPINNFYRVSKVFSIKKCQLHEMYLESIYYYIDSILYIENIKFAEQTHIHVLRYSDNNIEIKNNT